MFQTRFPNQTQCSLDSSCLFFFLFASGFSPEQVMRLWSTNGHLGRKESHINHTYFGSPSTPLVHLIKKERDGKERDPHGTRWHGPNWKMNHFLYNPDVLICFEVLPGGWNQERRQGVSPFLPASQTSGSIAGFMDGHRAWKLLWWSSQNSSPLI